MSRSRRSTGTNRGSSGSSNQRSSSGGMSNPGSRPSRTGASTNRSNSSSRSPGLMGMLGGMVMGGGRSRGYSSYGRQSFPRRMNFNFMSIIPIVIALGLLMFNVGKPSSATSATVVSTVERVPISKSLSKETTYLTDELGWISKKSTLEKGMKSFYKETGVQPHLYITGDIAGNPNPSQSEVDDWLDAKYSELFTDEAHSLTLFLDNGVNYGVWTLAGSATKTVLDQEGLDILNSHIELNVETDLSEEEFFSKSFADAGKSMMHVEKSKMPMVILISVLILGGVLILFIMIKRNQRNRELELEEDRLSNEILNTPLEEINSTEDNLYDRYR